jgi:hypothetical protein
MLLGIHKLAAFLQLELFWVEWLKNGDGMLNFKGKKYNRGKKKCGV